LCGSHSDNKRMLRGGVETTEVLDEDFTHLWKPQRK